MKDAFGSFNKVINLKSLEVSKRTTLYWFVENRFMTFSSLIHAWAFTAVLVSKLHDCVGQKLLFKKRLAANTK